MASDQSTLLRRLRKQGFTIEQPRRGHLRVTHPDAEGFIVMACTPGKGRAMRNAVAQLKRIGYQP